jgi:hypothetical protein
MAKVPTLPIFNNHIFTEVEVSSASTDAEPFIPSFILALCFAGAVVKASAFLSEMVVSILAIRTHVTRAGPPRGGGGANCNQLANFVAKFKIAK